MCPVRYSTGHVILTAAGEVIVERDDDIPLVRREQLGDVRADVAGAARDENRRHGLGARAADRRVREADRTHLVHGVEIATVDENGSPERFLDAREVWMPVLVPIGDDDDCITACGGFVGISTQADVGDDLCGVSIATGS